MRTVKAQLMGMVSGKSEKPRDSTNLPDSATIIQLSLACDWLNHFFVESTYHCGSYREPDRFGRIDLLDAAAFFGLENGHLRHQIIKDPLRGLDESCALSGARKTFIKLEGGAPKRRFLTRPRSKVTFLQFYTGFHPLPARRTPDPCM